MKLPNSPTSVTWKETIGDFCVAIATIVCFVPVIFGIVCIIPFFIHGPIRSLSSGDYEVKSLASLAHISEVLDAIFGILIISTTIIGRYLYQLVKKE